MKKKKKTQDYIIQIITVSVFAGLILLLIFAEGTSKAMQDPESVLRDKFRSYFLVSAMVNFQANNAIMELSKHGQQKTIDAYFQCNTMLNNIKQARRLRKEIMNEFSYLHELNCFSKFTEPDLKKYTLLENQCRSKTFDKRLPEELQKIYSYQKEQLNTGCIRNSELWDILSETEITKI